MVATVFYLFVSLLSLFASLIGFIAMFGPETSAKPGVIPWLPGWIFTLFCAAGLFWRKRWGRILVLLSAAPCFAISIIGIPVMAIQGEWVLVLVPYSVLFALSLLVLIYFTRPRIKGYFCKLEPHR